MDTVDSELKLVRLIATDEPAAMRLIYSTYIRQLTAVCSRYITDDEDVKDVLQESFIKIFGSLHSFHFAGKGSLKAWMTKILINEALRFIRRTKRIEFTPIPDNIAEISDDEEPDTECLSAETIHRFIRSLPDGYRMIFNLYVIEGKSHGEIASMLGIGESTSASQLHRAKALLAAKIKDFLSSNPL